ncbi:MAG: DUF4418 family protein [Anaerolineae bacterium]|nr:DUF4418 family protein [Anaerolineae bacterium]
MKIAGVAIIVLAVVLAVVPMFTDCQSAGRALTLESGKQVPMKCHWTGLAELGLSLPLAPVGLMMILSRRKESRRVLGITGMIFGVVAILLPTLLIGVCANPDMSCLSIMKPAEILAGVLVIGASLGVVIASWGKEKDLE